jgi:serine phosphatase RsbU (regulator of sigma subunit)
MMLGITPRPPMTASIERRFRAYHDALVHQWAGTVAMLGAALVPLFLVLDWFMIPRELFADFARYRGIVTGLVAVQFLLIRLTRPTRFSILHTYFTTIVVGAGISWMTVQLGGFDSSYYAGLNLVVAANLLVPWRASHSALNSFTTLLIYVFLNTVFGGAFHLGWMLNNLFFLGGTAVIAIATATGKYDLIVKEFASRVELEDANASLERSRAELKAARDALWGEMEVAKRIQTSLLPENRRVGAYDVAARMLPAAEVGGDYYDIIQAGEDRHWIAIGDVSGHGVESGLVMMMTQTSILSLVQENPRLSPAEVFSAVNDVLLENISRLHAARYMTLNVVRMRDEGLTVAGKHQDMLVWRRATGEVETISNEGCWIGIVQDTRGHVADQDIPMREGDLALFFTDGATEAMNAAGEMYGEERLAAVLARVAEGPLDDALEALFADIAAFRAVQDDDVTMMLVRRAPDAAAVHSRSVATTPAPLAAPAPASSAPQKSKSSAA